MRSLKIFILLLITTWFFSLSESASSYTAPENSEVSVEEMLGQMLLFGFRGTGFEKDYAYDVEDLEYFLKLVEQNKIGGVLLFTVEKNRPQSPKNIINKKQVKSLVNSLQSKAKTPLFIGIDQEGGKVQRLKASHGFSDFPSAFEQGKLTDEKLTELAKKMGTELHSVGINLNFAPCVDVLVEPKNPVIAQVFRSFSSEAKIVALKALAVTKGLNSAGVIACYKHFPGHGSSTTDTHVEFTNISKSWSVSELLPYQELLNKPGSYMLMTGHLYLQQFDNKNPASLSKKIVLGLLRSQLNYQGVVITDDLQMQAIHDNYSLEEIILNVINSGSDILLFGNNLNYQKELPQEVHALMLKLYGQGKISKERITESYQRIMAVKKNM